MWFLTTESRIPCSDRKTNETAIKKSINKNKNKNKNTTKIVNLEKLDSQSVVIRHLERYKLENLVATANIEKSKKKKKKIRRAPH